MKDFVANQLVKYLEARGVKHVFGLCGHTNIAVLAALSKSDSDQVHQHAARAGRRAHGGRLCAGKGQTSVVLSHLVAGAHECSDRRCERGAGFDPDGRDRRRRADALSTANIRTRK